MRRFEKISYDMFKKLVSDETEEVSENINRRNAVSEGYTRRLLGDN